MFKNKLYKIIYWLCDRLNHPTIFPEWWPSISIDHEKPRSFKHNGKTGWHWACLCGSHGQDECKFGDQCY